MSRVFGRSLAATVAVLAVAGCMMPAYRAPAGFSSTYFRHLYSQDPRALPHRLPDAADDSEINGLPADDLPPAPTRLPDDVVAPESQVPKTEQPSLPLDPRNQPSPPEPLPGNDAKLQGPRPIDSTTHGTVPQQERIPKSLPNTAMSVDFGPTARR